MKPQPKVNTAVVLKSIEKKAAPVMKKLLGLGVIKSKADFEKAGQLMKELKDLDAVATVEEKKITDPLQQALRAAKSHFKPFHDSVIHAQSVIKADMTAWVNKQDALVTKTAAALVSGEIKKVGTFLKHTEAAAVNKQSEHSTVRKIKVLVEVDAKKTPREFLIPDEAAIKAAIISGRVVAGWEIQLQNTIAI